MSETWGQEGTAAFAGQPAANDAVTAGALLRRAQRMRTVSALISSGRKISKISDSASAASPFEGHLFNRRMAYDNRPRAYEVCCIFMNLVHMARRYHHRNTGPGSEMTPILAGGQPRSHTFPMILRRGNTPQRRESLDAERLSPRT